MKLKHLVVLPAMLFVFIAKAQTGTFDKINVRSSLKLQNLKNTASGLNFISTDASGNLKFNPLKKGNGISSVGDSLYLGGDFSEINLSHKDGQTYFTIGDGYFSVQTVNSNNGYYSRINLGGGATTIHNYSGNRETQLTLYQNELAFNDGVSDKFKVDNTGVTNVTNLKVIEGFKVGVFRTSEIGQPDLRDGGCVFVLDDLTENGAVTLPDPAIQVGRVYYLFNANTSTTYNYTTNYPIYKSGSVSFTSIPGNIELRVMIVSDGEKWIQLN